MLSHSALLFEVCNVINAHIINSPLGSARPFVARHFGNMLGAIVAGANL